MRNSGSLTEEDVTAEIRDWLRNARVGVLRIEFGPKVIHHFTREEQIAAPPSTPLTSTPTCPACHGPLLEEDYGAKGRCVPCDVVYSMWMFRRSSAKVLRS